MLEIIENKGISKLSLPLPIYTSVTLATAKSNDGEEFEIIAGLDKNSVDEIKKHALDEGDIELQKNTRDRKRFGEGSYEKWYAKDRTPFGLIHKKTGPLRQSSSEASVLAAFVWFGPEPISKKSNESLSVSESEKNNRQKSDKWYTIGYRSYNPLRGKGLMKDFVKFAMKIYSASRPGIHYWTGTNIDNKASAALSSSLGLEVSEENSDRAAKWLVMIK